MYAPLAFARFSCADCERSEGVSFLNAAKMFQSVDCFLYPE
jgi:hypothetical protein